MVVLSGVCVMDRVCVCVWHVQHVSNVSVFFDISCTQVNFTSR